MFSIEHWKLTPDIITLAKAMSSGYAPIGAAIAKLTIAEAFVGSDEKALRHVFSFGGHPAACAAALKNIELLERERLVENSHQMGIRLRDGLDSLNNHPVVGDVRSLGLLAGVELVIDRKSKTSISEEDARLITRYFKDEGVLTRVNTVLCLAPPLCITTEQVNWLVEVIDRVLVKFERKRGMI